MTHRQWVAAQKRAMALSKSKPAAAARLLQRLATSIESRTRSAAGAWHFEQTLGLASIMQSAANDRHGACATLGRLADHHEAVLRYQQRALVSTLSAQALELLAINQRTRAAESIRRATPWAHTLRPGDELFRRARRVLSARSRGAKAQATTRRSTRRRAARP
jgi:hypothetical protein